MSGSLLRPHSALLAGKNRAVILLTPTFFLRQNAQKTPPARPRLTLLHLHEMLFTVAAFHDGLLEALFHIGLIAFGFIIVVFEFQIYGRVREGHIVENDVF